MKNKPIPVLVLVSLIAALLTVGAQAATVGYWRFEEGAGTTTDDSSTNSNVGTLLSGATFSTETPAFGLTNVGSLALDGVDDTMEVPDAAALDVTSAFTLEAFVRIPVGVSEPGGAGIALKRNAAGNSTSYGLFFASGNTVRAQVHTVPTGFLAPSTSAPLSANEWHHVAAVYGGGELRLYVDHNLVSSVARLPAQPIETSSNPLAVGEYSATFAGLIDEVRLSDVALSPGQFLGGIFGDGFESGNTLAWSSAVP